MVPGSSGGTDEIQRARMRMLRAGKDGLDRSLLDDLAAIHDQHAATEMANDGQIVRDKEHGEAELGAQPRQEIEKLRLDGDIQTETISSAIRIFGILQRARAILMRWRWPPDSCPGNRVATSAGRPTSASSSLVRASRSSQLA